MAALTFYDLLDEALHLIGDPRPGMTLGLPLAQRTFRHAYARCWERVGRINQFYLNRTATISWKAGQQRYPLPPDFRAPNLVRRTGGARIEITTPTNLANQDSGYWPYWHESDLALATPAECCIIGKQIAFRNAPASNLDDAVTIDYLPEAPEPAFGRVSFASENSIADVESPNISEDHDSVGGVTITETRWRARTPSGIQATTYESLVETGAVLHGRDAVSARAVWDTLSNRSPGVAWGNLNSNPQGLDLATGSRDSDHVIISIYVWDMEDVGASAVNGSFTADFYSPGPATSPGPNRYQKRLYWTDTRPAGESQYSWRQGWNHLAIRKSAFVESGNPGWRDIRLVAFGFAVGSDLWPAGWEVKFTLDGFRVADLRAHTAEDVLFLTDTAALQSIGATGSTVLVPEYPALNEWAVLETAVKLASGKRRSELREDLDECRDTFLRGLAAGRNRQSIEKIGDSLW